jgi:hypothetical protein
MSVCAVSACMLSSGGSDGLERLHAGSLQGSLGCFVTLGLGCSRSSCGICTQGPDCLLVVMLSVCSSCLGEAGRVAAASLAASPDSGSWVVGSCAGRAGLLIVFVPACCGSESCEVKGGGPRLCTLGHRAALVQRMRV